MAHSELPPAAEDGKWRGWCERPGGQQPGGAPCTTMVWGPGARGRGHSSSTRSLGQPGRGGGGSGHSAFVECTHSTWGVGPPKTAGPTRGGPAQGTLRALVRAVTAGKSLTKGPEFRVSSHEAGLLPTSTPAGSPTSPRRGPLPLYQAPASQASQPLEPGVAPPSSTTKGYGKAKVPESAFRLPSAPPGMEQSLADLWPQRSLEGQPHPDHPTPPLTFPAAYAKEPFLKQLTPPSRELPSPASDKDSGFRLEIVGASPPPPGSCLWRWVFCSRASART